MTMKTERRRHVRVPGPFHATARVHGRDLPVRLLNLSEGGCYIESDRLRADNGAIELTIALPAGGSIHVTGETLFSRHNGYAVLFGDMSEAEYARLERIVNDLRSMVP